MSIEQSSQQTGEQSQARAVVVSAFVFLTTIVIINRELFRVAIWEYTDFAANALQIERAKHFHELLGNYSRWGFHHPGPFFFYYFALGEKVLHDWLHVVPAEMNAHIVFMIVLNTAFLFGAIGIIAGRCRSRLFPPAALGLSLLFIYVVNCTIPGSAIFSIWMPHVLMFCFLFFLTAGASLAGGRTAHLPWMILSGCTLIHGHVAQPLFVGTLGTMAVVTVWWRCGRSIGTARFIRQNRKAIAVSLLVIVVFSLPIVLDVTLHHDNNVRAILRHSALHQGLQQPFLKSLKYESSFFAFIAKPEVVLESPRAGLIKKALARPEVATLWCLGALMLGLTLWLFRKSHDSVSLFVRYGVFEILVVAALFYYWTLKMTGALFNFNGYFFFSVELLALLLMASVILDGFQLNVKPTLSVVLCALMPLSMFAGQRGFLNTEKGEIETDRLVATLPQIDGQPVHLSFDGGDWMIEAGIASRLQHEHQSFCVDDLWAFTFGRDHRCQQFKNLDNLILSRVPEACEAPCRLLMKDDRFELELTPYPELKLPFTIKPDDRTSLNKGFNEFLGTAGPVWATAHATIYFRLAPDFGDAPRVRLKIFGTANPDHPVKILLNDHFLGTITAGHDTSEFTVDRTLLVPGENRLVIQVDDPLKVPGDPQNNPRVLGFSFGKAEFESARN